MDNEKIYELVRRVRNANKASDLALADLERELQKDQVPIKARKRRNLKAGRIENIERYYATRGVAR